SLGEKRFGEGFVEFRHGRGTLRWRPADGTVAAVASMGIRHLPRAALKGNATSGLRADERGHGLYSRRTSPFLDTSAVSQAGRLGGDGHRIDAYVGPTSPSKVGPGSALCISQLSPVADFFHQMHDRAAKFRAFDAHVRFGQRQAVRRGKKLGHISGRWRIGGAFFFPRLRCSLKEEGDRHLEKLREMLETTCRD